MTTLSRRQLLAAAGGQRGRRPRVCRSGITCGRCWPVRTSCPALRPTYTNTARYAVRPVGPALAGAVQSVALGAPFLIAGTVKSAYDLVLWRWFRHVHLPTDTDGPNEPGPAPAPVEEAIP